MKYLNQSYKTFFLSKSSEKDITFLYRIRTGIFNSKCFTTKWDARTIFDEALVIIVNIKFVRFAPDRKFLNVRLLITATQSMPYGSIGGAKKHFFSAFWLGKCYHLENNFYIEDPLALTILISGSEPSSLLADNLSF